MSEVKQRWRLVFARDAEAQFLSHLDAVRLWERAFRRGEIPVATSEGFTPRSKLIFAAPLQLGMLAEHELADLFLAERLTAPDLRDRLAAGMPRGYRVVDLHDVWVGAPAMAPQLAAADYRLTLLNVERSPLERAAATLMAAERLPRERRKEERSIEYDLRPLLLDLRVIPANPESVPPETAAAVAATGLWMRLRHSQERGSGRADEVVAALADEMGLAAQVASAESGEPTAETAGIVDSSSSSGATAADADTAIALRREAAVPSGGAGAVIEVVRPVRERLWLAEELAEELGAAAEIAAVEIPNHHD